MEEADMDQQSHFSFPALSPDGSVDGLPRRYNTPPAALSSLGARFSRMADQNLSASTSSLADSQYDMIDDLSEISNDDQETASLASTEDRESDEEQVMQQDPMVEDAATGADPQRWPAEHIRQEMRDIDGMAHHEDDEHTTAQDSFLSDDLETPRQSTMRAFTRPSSPDSLSASVTALKPKSQPSSKQNGSILPTILRLITMLAIFPLIWTVLSGLTFFQLNPVAQTALRREALSSALEYAMTGNSSDVTRTVNSVNIEHLLPMPTATSVDFLGQRTYATQDRARYQLVTANHVIVSLPRQSGYSSYPSPKTVEVLRGNYPLASKTTKLIDGVYDISIDLAEAYGVVDIHMATKNPSTNQSFPTNFGLRMLPRTDISKAVNKDLTVARKAATDLAVTWSRDLQVMANSAVSIYNTAASSSRKTLISSLAASRERALALKEKVRSKALAI